MIRGGKRGEESQGEKKNKRERESGEDKESEREREERQRQVKRGDRNIYIYTPSQRQGES